jgi:peptidyl-prolyl cis-trans isomerase B (cyclophilin B)
MTARTKYLAVLLACLALVASGCGSSSSKDGNGSSTSATGECKYIKSGQPAARKVKFPSSTPTETGSVKVEIGTNFGDVAAVLDAKNAPCAVNSFLSLAKQGYYDKTNCSRVAFNSQGPFAIVQCGDPTGTGAGAPGYRFAEEVTGKETYSAGVIAMAKASTPASTGGQFFIALADTQLGPEYTVLGKLSTQGLKTMRKAGLAALKGKTDGYDGPPATKVELTKVR